MPPIPRRDYSIPRPAGYQLGTDGKRVSFPTVQRAALAVHNLVRRFFPTPGDSSARGGSPQPVGQAVSRTTPAPWTNPNWPKDHTAVIREPGK